MKKVFIGIDFSKLKFDAVLLFDAQNKPIHAVFSNDTDGYQSFISWCESQTYHKKNAWLVCGEHTGLYSLGFTSFLNMVGIDIWLEPGLQIKRSMGMTRGKSDKVDAHHIALYACRFIDKANSTKIRTAVLDQIKDLLTYRERLLSARNSFLVAAKELHRFKSNTSVSYIYEDSLAKAKDINRTIKELQKQISLLVAQEEELHDNYQLLLSIKGIGAQNALFTLVLTDNFTLFDNARKFGCYAGVVPFGHTSGTSIRNKERVSHLANKKMKALLSNAANSAVIHDKTLKEYYIRKLQEGKDRALVINNVRNKLVHIMFGVIKNRKPYDSNYSNDYKKSA